jgi:hypothetical protein
MSKRMAGVLLGLMVACNSEVPSSPTGDAGAGGTPSGGAPSGGAASGGAVSGGAASGGAASGGAASGGAASGGSQAGGVASGGAQPGGAPAGGDPPVGGEAPVGGAPVGGAPVGGAPAGGQPVPPADALDCALVCLTFAADCPEAADYASACDTTCAAVNTGLAGNVHPETYALARETCQTGVRTNDCGALYACLADDDDGITAVGDGFSLTYDGVYLDETLALEGASAWGVVATKRAGTPGNLEILFEAQGETMVLAFDDLAGLVLDNPDSAVGARVDLKRASGKLSMDIVSIDVARFSLNGAVEFDVVLGDANLDVALANARVHVEGQLGQ